MSAEINDVRSAIALLETCFFRFLFLQQSIMLFHISPKEGVFISHLLQNTDSLLRLIVIASDDIQGLLLIRDASGDTVFGHLVERDIDSSGNMSVRKIFF